MTNTISSGAVKCTTCRNQEQCVPCPSGQYLETEEDHKQQARRSTKSETKSDINAHFLHPRNMIRSTSMAAAAAVTVLSHKSISSNKNDLKCVKCPEKTVINGSLAFPRGREASCVACGPGLTSDQDRIECIGDCIIHIDGDTFDLSKLPKPLQLKGGDLFTTGGTAYYHAFNFTLCGAPKTLCSDNNTQIFNTFKDMEAAFGIQAMACRSTLLPDQGQIYSTQSVSLGDDLIAITREPSYNGIDVHKEFLGIASDIHFYYTTDAITTACSKGRALTVTLRCDLHSHTIAAVSAPTACPEGTCDGCTYHLLVRSNTSAACRACRDADYETVVGECISGQQVVHFINPKGCVIPEHKLPVPRPCAILPKQVQLAIAVIAGLGVILLILVFHFWKTNKALQYKVRKVKPCFILTQTSYLTNSTRSWSTMRIPLMAKSYHRLNAVWMKKMMITWIQFHLM